MSNKKFTIPTNVSNNGVIHPRVPDNKIEVIISFVSLLDSLIIATKHAPKYANNIGSQLAVIKFNSSSMIVSSAI